jgi:hypothetical protein
VLIFGGEEGAGTFEKNEAYDPTTDSWTALMPLPTPRHGFGAAVFDSAIYLPGGRHARARLRDRSLGARAHFAHARALRFVHRAGVGRVDHHPNLWPPGIQRGTGVGAHGGGGFVVAVCLWRLYFDRVHEEVMPQ